MERSEEAVEIRKLIIELSSVGTDDADLDDLIERLINVLKHSPEVGIVPAGVLFLQRGQYQSRYPDGYRRLFPEPCTCGSGPAKSAFYRCAHRQDTVQYKPGT